tara:strand:- start:4866 stop:6287 length:1422 start_codon:yes stop_codon:yes gene_type:complete
MNYKGIFYYLGIFSSLVSIFSFLNILYSIYFNSVINLNSYIFSLCISLLLSILFLLIGKNSNKNISPSDQLILILVTFIFIPILISIPYLLSNNDMNFIDSYFESISGFTTTGFSILPNINNIDEPLLLWRSSSQLLGGLIFLTFAVGTLGSKYVKIKPTYLLSEENLVSNFYNNFNYNFIKILTIYFLSTLFIIFFYTVANIRLLDSFNLAFTTISSGGFIPTDNLSDIIIHQYQLFIVTLTLLLPIFNFYLFFKIFTGKFNLNNHQEDLHLGFLILFLILFIYFFIISDENVFSVSFAVISSIATSGISVNSSNFDFPLFFILLTIIGGSLLSTSSGIKYVRFYILLKFSQNEIYRLVKPINIFNRNLFNSQLKIDYEDTKICFLVFIFFLLAIFILSSILTFENLSFQDSFNLSILTMTNTASSSLYGIDNIYFNEMNNFTKVSLIIFMILARIEIIAVLFLIKKFVYKE